MFLFSHRFLHTTSFAMAKQSAIVELFYDSSTSTATYLVGCSETKKCAVIDPVWDFDLPSGALRTKQADSLLNRIGEQGWSLDWILETHAHADHLSSSQYLKKKGGGKVCIGEGITKVQEAFRPKFNFDFPTDGSQFDHLFRDGEEFSIGNLQCQVMGVPGHTPDSVCYYIKDDCVFPGDTLFMPDSGTARCDFPNGSAEDLYDSAQKILSLPQDVRFFVCHDYQPGGRKLEVETTIGDQAATNKHVKKGISQEEFVKMRTERDSTLNVPKLLFPSVQVNMLAGNLPPAEKDGVSYLKIPLSQE
jgi:glyoxylase-like metal-dependent hydrolase (beta-lactamase superfamily II)